MNCLVCGTRKTGKSTLALFLASQWGGTVVIFDPRGSYRGVGIQCPDIDSLMQHLEDMDYIENGIPCPLVYHVDADAEKSFADLCARLFPPRFEGWSGRIALIVDESRNLQSHQFISPTLDRLVGQAPIDDVLVIQTTHEIKEWNSKTKSVMDEVYLFYQVGPQNYSRIEELCGTDVADQVQDFAPHSKDDPVLHHYVRYSFREFFDEGRQWELCDDPRIWYIPLGAQNRLPGNRDTDGEVSV
jgi:hypothetical protein